MVIHMEDIKLIKSGIRLDGRKLDETRPIEAKVGILKRANGSAYFRIGNTIAIAGVMGPRRVYPKHMEQADRAILRTDYRMAPFSTTDRSRPGPNRRSTEISMVTRKAIEPVLFLEEFPKTSIDVFIEIIQADASTRCAGINAAALALADAGIPMRDLVSSCSAGIVENHVVLDVAGKEDMEGELDLPIAFYPKKKQITLLQMDGIVPPEQFKKILHLAIKGCEKIYEEQKKALRARYQIELAE
ncbi:MAG: exosome complex exonuclease Rrp41 [Candidatus Aenigmarchaeota archaeon]|nr:exosome complex exonuclease Rrp41 [Candidatus Aenigmarchaeota archaeon]